MDRMKLQAKRIQWLERQIAAQQEHMSAAASDHAAQINVLVQKEQCLRTDLLNTRAVIQEWAQEKERKRLSSLKVDNLLRTELAELSHLVGAEVTDLKRVAIAETARAAQREIELRERTSTFMATAWRSWQRGEMQGQVYAGWRFAVKRMIDMRRARFAGAERRQANNASFLLGCLVVAWYDVVLHSKRCDWAAGRAELVLRRTLLRKTFRRYCRTVHAVQMEAARLSSLKVSNMLRTELAELSHLVGAEVTDLKRVAIAETARAAQREIELRERTSTFMATAWRSWQRGEMQGQVYAGWRFAVKRMIDMRRARFAGAERRQANKAWMLLNFAVDTWHGHTQQEKRRTWLDQRAASMFSNKALRKGFLCYRDTVSAAVRDRVLLVQGRLQCVKRCLDNVFEAWRELPAQSAYRRNVLTSKYSRILRGTLSVALTSWCTAAKEQQRIRTKLGTKMLSLMRGVLLWGMLSWQRKVASSRVLHRITGRQRDKAVLTALETWIAHKHQRRVLRRVISRITHLSLYSAMEHWREAVAGAIQHAAAQRLLNSRLQFMAAKWSKRLMWTALGEWADTSASARRAKQVAHLITKAYKHIFLLRQLAMVLRSWHTTAEENNRWRRHLRTRRSRIQLAAGAYRRRVIERLRATFGQFVVAVQTDIIRSQCLRSTCRLLQFRMRTSLMCGVWREWRAFCVTRFRHARLLVMSDLLFRTLRASCVCRVAVDVLRRWCCCTMAAKLRMCPPRVVCLAVSGREEGMMLTIDRCDMLLTYSRAPHTHTHTHTHTRTITTTNAITTTHDIPDCLALARAKARLIVRQSAAVLRHWWAVTRAKHERRHKERWHISRRCLALAGVAMLEWRSALKRKKKDGLQWRRRVLALKSKVMFAWTLVVEQQGLVRQMRHIEQERQRDQQVFREDSDRAMALWEEALQKREREAAREREERAIEVREWEVALERARDECVRQRETYESLRIARVAQTQHQHALQVVVSVCGVCGCV